MSIGSSSNNRKGAFGEVEAIKNSKMQIKRDQKLILYSVCFLVVGIIYFLFFGEVGVEGLVYIPIKWFNDTNGSIIMVDDLNNTLRDATGNPIYSISPAIKSKQNFINHYPAFFIFITVCLYLAYCFKSKAMYKPKKGTFRYIFGYPANKIFSWISVSLQIPDDLRPKIGFECSWLEKLEKDFFNQIVEKDDGFKRAKELIIFNDMSYIFGALIWKNIKRLFISQAHIEDLLKIFEGYLRAGLYDELWIGKNDIVNEQYANSKGLKNIPYGKLYEHFQSYKLRRVYSTDMEVNPDYDPNVPYSQARIEVSKWREKHSVVFSRNALKFFVAKHNIYFYNFINRMVFNSSNLEYDTREIRLLNALRGDISFNHKIERYYGVKTAKEFANAFESVETLMQNEKMRAVLFEMLLADFAFISFRSVLERFMGVPSGILVVKILDYDTRMILETYKSKSLVRIEPTKNDGSTELYHSDNYVNLFIALLVRYYDDPKTGFFQEIQEKFNTDLTAVPERESKEVFNRTSDYKEGEQIDSAREEEAEGEIKHPWYKKIKFWSKGR